MSRNAYLGAAAIAACFTLAVSACGDDDDDGVQVTPTPSPTPTATPTGTPQGRIVKFASLDGAQETPPIATAAVGAGMLEVDTGTGAVSGFVVTTGLTDVTAAHVHLEARGTPGGIIVPMEGGPDLWVVPDAAAPLTADQITAFQEDRLYFNVHTAANPNGEIRGQIDKTGSVRLAALDGTQETPPVTTTGLGAGVLAVDATSGEVSGFVFAAGLPDANNAHVHPAPRGTPGGVAVPMVGGPALWVIPDAAAPVDQALRDAFEAGGLYYNVHTPANPNGEIRGQLDKTGAVKIAALDGAQETPPVTTTGFGAGVLAVDSTSGQVSGFVIAAGLPDANNAHVHPAPRGTPGGVAVPMVGGPDLWVIPDAAAPIDQALRDAFEAGGLYYNVHTPANPNGEIRGQLE